jgi:hypothetical protein
MRIEIGQADFNPFPSGVYPRWGRAQKETPDHKQSGESSNADI